MGWGDHSVGKSSYHVSKHENLIENPRTYVKAEWVWPHAPVTQHLVGESGVGSRNRRLLGPWSLAEEAARLAWGSVRSPVSRE